MPYRSHVQHDDVEETLLGVLLLLLRLLRDVSEGTGEETSEVEISESESSSLLVSSESLICCAANRAESSPTVGCLNCSVVIVLQAFGCVGFGLWI
jgi:hypothetical protein